MASARHPPHHVGDGCAVRRVRSRRVHRGARARHRAPRGVGDRAVPLVLATASGARHRDQRGGARPPDQPGARHRAARRRGDPHGQRRARPAPARRVWLVGRETRRPAPRRLPDRARFSRTWKARSRRRSTCAWRRPPRPTTLDGTPSIDGRCALWVRFPDLEMSAAALAIVGDYVPFGIGQALGQHRGGNSLDNTLRVATVCRPSGCWPTYESTPSPTGSGTASCTSGPRTARCSAPPASPPSSVTRERESKS